jgi:rhodanese-related sulfurtransferase
MALSISRAELESRLSTDDIVLIDAQGPGLFEACHIPGAVSASVENQAAVLEAIGTDLDREIVTYCTDEACTGSGIATSLLEAAGYRNVRQFVGGVVEWSRARLPVATSKRSKDT